MMEGLWEPAPERLEHCYGEVERLSSLVSDLERQPVDLYALARTAAAGAVLCMAEQLSAFDRDNLIVPIWMI